MTHFTNSDYKVAQGATEGGAEACSLQAAQDDRLSNDGIRSNRNLYYTGTVCIFAHNEEKNIISTISSLLKSVPRNIPIIVYANGCTDRTISLCRQFMANNSQLQLRELPIASKVLAWNQAFDENSKVDYLIFADGDIEVAPMAFEQILKDLRDNPSGIIATGKQLPTWKLPQSPSMNWQQHLVGFFQLPLLQEFLGGAFYAFSRPRLQAKLATKGFHGIPQKVTCEDGFLEFILGPGELIISRALVYYTPGNFDDYIRYLARIRWQNEQLRILLGNQILDQTPSHAPILRKFWRKLLLSSSGKDFLLGLGAVLGRTLFKFINRKKIKRAYHNLGPIDGQGQAILTQWTRAKSTK